nr:immunoglobulin light chain junction region [Macaca mulatta]MOY07547.1 immunoglobulin light chain junction region [Macaca mulatta]MOY09353.1 immunoglobulin light chain junction region [Macaca mulatta]MOY10157.1 immunoglobulin light chain junction region [Macaca mulatta]
DYYCSLNMGGGISVF